MATSNTQSAILVRATERKLITIEKERAIFEGRYDPQWNIGVVPNGGYTLGIALSCGQEFVEKIRGKEQSSLLTNNASYLNKVSSEIPYQVEVRLLKTGRSTTNVEIDLVQNSGKGERMILCVRISALFANFEGLRSDKTIQTLTASNDEPFVSQFPLVMDPNDRSNERPWYSKHKIPTSIIDKKAQENLKSKENQFLEVLMMYFPDEKVEEKDLSRHNLTSISMIADMASNIHIMVPNQISKILKGMGSLWFPTMTLSIEFCHPLPNFPLQKFVTKSKSIYLVQGQWSYLIEIWSHPNDSEKLGLPKGQKSVLLAISQQTALIMSMAINQKKSSKM